MYDALLPPLATASPLDRSSGRPALKRIFDEAFEGILVTDFWAAYDAIPGGLHQCCLFHLLNELVKVDQRNLAAEWQAFARKTKRLIQDALQLWAGADFTPEAPCIAHRAALQTFAGFGVGPLHEHRYAPPCRAAGVRLSHLHF